VWSRSPRKTEARRLGPSRWVAAFAFVAVSGPFATAGEVADAVVTLEALSPLPVDQVVSALPLRFALLENGQVFVGGTSHLLAGRLGKDEVAAIEHRLGDIRKLPGLGGTVALGPDSSGVRLSIRKPKALDLLVKGDPAAAPQTLLPLAALVRDLLRFSHVSLRAYEPSAFALGAREGTLVGGCRPWTLPAVLAEVQSAPQLLPAGAATGWPTGATPALVCSGDKTYVVTLRPLVPGERP